MLYLETTQVPVKSVIIVRRLLYLQTILHRHKNEPTWQIYYTLKEDTIKYNWIQSVLKDISDIDLNLSDNQTGSLSKNELKKLVKSKMRSYTDEEFERVKKGH